MTPESGKSRRRLIALAVLVCVLLLFAVVQQAFNLSPFLSDPESQTTLFLWAFASLNVILLLTFILILLRHLLKLYFEQRSQRPGSRFHRKLLLSFLGVALVPGVFMSFFAYAVVNRNLDKWFSSPLDQAFAPLGIGEIARQVERDASQRAMSTARLLARHPDLQKLWTAPAKDGVRELERIAPLFEIPFAVVLDRSGDPLLAYRSGQAWLPTDPRFHEMARPLEVVGKSLSGQGLSEALNDQVWTVPWKEGSPAEQREQPLLLAGAQNESGGLIVGSRPPVEMASFARELSGLSREYEQMKEQRKMIRTNFMLVLGVVTLLVLFPAVWIALFLSRKITEPIRALAEASNEVSQGNLSVQVDSPAPDELGVLVSSFNRMTSQLDEAARDLASKNRDLAESHRGLGSQEAIHRGGPGKHSHRSHLHRRRLVHQHHERGRPADAGEDGRHRSVAGGVVSTPRPGRDPKPDGQGSPGENRFQGAGNHDPTGNLLRRRDPQLAGPGGCRTSKVRNGAGGLDRAAQSPEGHRMARGGSAHGSRDQESTDSDSALG